MNTIANTLEEYHTRKNGKVISYLMFREECKIRATKIIQGADIVNTTFIFSDNSCIVMDGPKVKVYASFKPLTEAQLEYYLSEYSTEGLLDIINHGIHNITNNFNNELYDYDAIAKQCGELAQKIIYSRTFHDAQHLG